MNIYAINFLNTNNTFNGRKSIIPKDELEKILRKSIEENIPIETIAIETGYSKATIRNFLHTRMKFSYSREQIAAEKEKLRPLLTEYVNNNKSIKEISKLIHKGFNWTRNCLEEFGLIAKNKDVPPHLELLLHELIQTGYTLKQMSEILNISTFLVSRNIEKLYGKSIIDIRHENNFKLRRVFNKEDEKFKKELEGYIAQNMTIVEMSKAIGCPSSKIMYWLKAFKLTPNKQAAHERMKLLIPDMISKKMTIEQMAAETGVSHSTISRWIRKTYGKSYIDIRMGK